MFWLCITLFFCLTDVQTPYVILFNDEYDTFLKSDFDWKTFHHKTPASDLRAVWQIKSC